MFEKSRINEIAGHIRAASGKVSFILGAGASKTADIPLAIDLIQCVEEKYPHCLNALSDKDRQNYGKVMGVLSPGERENLIVPILQNAKINWGHIALASLMRQQYVERVLTFNFDLILERAASILGVHLPVYDFGVSPTKDINRLVKSSIIHLHGQSHGMVLLNSEEEIKKNIENIRPIISETIRSSVTIVIGYSGSADGIFPIISDEYNSFHRLFWLGYEKTCPTHLESLISQDFAEYIGECDFDQTMIDVAQAIGAWPPLILKNPMDHTLEILEPTTEFPVFENTTGDWLFGIRKRLKDYSVRWTQETNADSAVFDVALGVSGNLDQLGVLDESDLTEDSKTAFSWMYMKEAIKVANEAIDEKTESKIQRFTKAYQYFARAHKYNPNNSQSMYNWGITLLRQAETLPDYATPDIFIEAGEKFSKSASIDPSRAHTFASWGVCLGREAKYTKDEVKAKKRINEAIEKISMAIKISAFYPEFYESITTVMLEDVVRFNYTDLEKENIYNQIEDNLLMFSQLTSKTSFNSVCVFSLRGNVEKAIQALYDCFSDGLLPSAQHLDRDTDLSNIRSDPRYISLRSNLS